MTVFQPAISTSSLYFGASGLVLYLSSSNFLGILMSTHGLHAAILGKKSISILCFGPKPPCALSISLRVRATMDNHYIQNENASIHYSAAILKAN